MIKIPWSVKKNNDKFCVVKDDGTVVKCHPSELKANAHLRALYANEPNAKK